LALKGIEVFGYFAIAEGIFFLFKRAWDFFSK